MRQRLSNNTYDTTLMTQPTPNSFNIYIAKTSMLTPLGSDSTTTMAAICAGISAYAASHRLNQHGNPMTMGEVPPAALPELKSAPETKPELNMSKIKGRDQRMIRLASKALTELLSELNITSHIPLFLATPESTRHYSHKLTAHFVAQLAYQTNLPLSTTNSKLFAEGRAGGIHALQAATQYIQQGGAFAVVGGVDSFHDALLLGLLDQDNRVLAQDISDGFAPSEAASFLLLVSEKHKSRFKNANSIINMPATAQEPGHRYSDEPMMGEGLSHAFKAAAQTLPNNAIQTVYASFNGESFHTKEFGIAMTRNHAKMHDDVTVEHPGDCLGDIGAAFAPILCALAARNLKSKNSLIFCSSDNALRGAVCITQKVS